MRFQTNLSRGQSWSWRNLEYQLALNEATDVAASIVILRHPILSRVAASRTFSFNLNHNRLASSLFFARDGTVSQQTTHCAGSNCSVWNRLFCSREHVSRHVQPSPHPPPSSAAQEPLLRLEDECHKHLLLKEDMGMDDSRVLLPVLHQSTQRTVQGEDVQVRR